MVLRVQLMQEVLGHRAGGVFTPPSQQILHISASPTRELVYSSPLVGRHESFSGQQAAGSNTPSLPHACSKAYSVLETASVR